MHRHSGGYRRDPFFAEIQYRGQKTSICESEKRDASGCLRKVLRLPRSVFPRLSCPKLTPHISTDFVHDGTISSKKLSWHILSWHASRVGAAEWTRRGGIPGGARPRNRAPSCAAAFLRAPLWMRQGTRRMRVRQGAGWAGIGRFASRATRCLEQCGGEGGRWWGPWRKLRSETALPHCCLLPRKSIRHLLFGKTGRDCLRCRSSELRLLACVCSICYITNRTEKESDRRKRHGGDSGRSTDGAKAIKYPRRYL